MSESTARLRDETYVKTVITEMGGVQQLAVEIREYHEIVVRMRAEQAELLKKHTDRWIAMGRHGVLAVGDSMKEVLEEAERQGVDSGDTVVEFMDTSPPLLILWSSANSTARGVPT